MSNRKNYEQELSEESLLEDNGIVGLGMSQEEIAEALERIAKERAAGTLEELPF